MQRCHCCQHWLIAKAVLILWKTSAVIQWRLHFGLMLHKSSWTCVPLSGVHLRCNSTFISSVMIIMCNSKWFVHKPSSQSLTIIIILIIIMRTHTTPGGLCINHLNLHHSTFTADHSTIYSCHRHNHTYAIVIVILISTLHSSLVCIQLGHIMLVWYFAMSLACHEK